MKIQILDYPRTFDFEINEKLPAFKFGCKRRTNIIRMVLEQVDYTAPHMPDDFIVEEVIKTEDGEIWHLGS